MQPEHPPPLATQTDGENGTQYFGSALHTGESNFTTLQDLDESSTSFWRSMPPVSYLAHVSTATFMIPVTIMAIGGNGLVIYLFFKFRSLRTAGNILLVNLALSDLLMASTGFPLFLIAAFKGRWTLGQTGCNFYGATGSLFGLMSINSMVVITVDRYLTICRNKKLTRMQSYLLVLWVWLYTLPWALAPLFGWSSYALEAYETTCGFDYIDTKHHWFLLTVILGDFVIPLVVITYCYGWILVTIKRHKKEFKSILEQNRDTQSPSSFSPSYRDWRKPNLIGRHLRGRTMKTTLWKKSEYKIARTFLVVIVMYCASWAPYAIVTLIGQYGDRTLITRTGAMVPILLAKLSTVYNPFIFILKHPRFKSALRKTFPQWIKRFTDKRTGRQQNGQVMLELDYLKGNRKANYHQNTERRSSRKNGIKSLSHTESEDMQMPLEIKVSHRERSVDFTNGPEAVEFLVKWVKSLSEGDSGQELKVMIKNKAPSKKPIVEREESSYSTETELFSTTISSGVSEENKDHHQPKQMPTPRLLPKQRNRLKPKDLSAGLNWGQRMKLMSSTRDLLALQ